LVAPYVDNPDTFDSAVHALGERIQAQSQAVAEFLATH
jgi:hypothetical protein